MTLKVSLIIHVKIMIPKTCSVSKNSNNEGYLHHIYHISDIYWLLILNQQLTTQLDNHHKLTGLKSLKLLSHFINKLMNFGRNEIFNCSFVQSYFLQNCIKVNKVLLLFLLQYLHFQNNKKMLVLRV